MKKQGGFTLIELVVVIVILGILAVTAAPKFLNLQDDAKVSAVKGLSGAMKGAIGITYGKAAVAGIESVSSGESIEVEGNTVNLAYGSPETAADLEYVVDGLSNDWYKFDTNPAGTESAAAVYGYKGFNCVAAYYVADGTNSATAKVVDTSGDNSVSGCETPTGSNE